MRRRRSEVTPERLKYYELKTWPSGQQTVDREMSGGGVRCVFCQSAFMKDLLGECEHVPDMDKRFGPGCLTRS